MTLLSSLFPKYATSRILALALALAVAVGLAACDSSPTGNDDGDSPTVTYREILGEWTGDLELQSQAHPTELSIVNDVHVADKEIGTLVRFVEERGGEVLCRGDLLAKSSVPPEYRMSIAYTEGASNCSPESFRLEEGAEAETLIAHAKPSGASSYVEAGTLTKATVTYQAVEGEWAGTNVDGNWLRVEFRTDSAKVGKEIGAVFDLESEGGELACQADISALSSDPATVTYWVRYVSVEGTCRPTGTFRFEHDPVNGTLFMEYKPDSEDEYLTAGTLSRKDD